MKKAVIFDMYETLITHYEIPLYFGTQMAADMGISKEEFLPLWRSTEDDRTLGKLTLEEVVKMIMEENSCYNEDVFQRIIEKRNATKRECFNHLNPQIIPMLSELKAKGVKIGLISNCFSEEAFQIRQSILMPYFDEVCLSYEIGLQKPQKEIFEKCVQGLDVSFEDCLYIGDGGSFELETAKSLGMEAIQATWYYKKDMGSLFEYKNGFKQIDKPLEILDMV